MKEMSCKPAGIHCYISGCRSPKETNTDLPVSDWKHLSVESLRWWPLSRFRAGRTADDELGRDALATTRVIVLVGDAVEEQLHRSRAKLPDRHVHGRQRRIHITRQWDVVESGDCHLLRNFNARLA